MYFYPLVFIFTVDSIAAVLVSPSGSPQPLRLAATALLCPWAMHAGSSAGPHIHVHLGLCLHCT